MEIARTIGVVIAKLVMVAGITTGMVALGLGRRASRSGTSGQVPDWWGFVGIGVAVVIWVGLNVVSDGGADAAG